IHGSLKHAGIPLIEIERSGDEVRILIHAAQPGRVIGRRGAEVDRLKAEIQDILNRKVTINIKEVEKPELDPQLVAEGIADQLVRRYAFRRAMRRAMESVRQAGALGVKIRVGGRLGGSEMSRFERYIAGALPLQTLDADVQYGFAEAKTTYGIIGVKVWIYRGKIEKEKEETVRAINA
ncbi:unnamed protein product, partial [marine sediment metagenome]